MIVTLNYVSPLGAVTAIPAPVLVDGYQASRATNNVFVDLLDGGTGVIVSPAKNRTGTLKLLYSSALNAYNATFQLGRSGSFEFYLSEEPNDYVEMDFVVNGDVRMSLDEQTRELWVVEVDFLETSSM